MFPELIPARKLRKTIDNAVENLVAEYGDILEQATQPFIDLLVWLEQGLRQSPWWLVLLVVAGLTWLGSRRWQLTFAMPALLAFIGAIGLWDQGMQTLALMIVATGLSILIGIPTGILMSRSTWLRKIILPILDIMQTMPSFVYLIPVVMLFGLGKIPAIIATVIYAVPPLIRLTDLGIRLVDKEVLEASQAFGANTRQQLLGIQLPLALPNIMAGINQTTMMALAMVVIASMIGAKGLGQEVLMGINRLEVGRGLLAGLAIVALAILFDRITQSFGQRRQQQEQSA
ncbi:proline/glycine betaine ABC transporter permease [Endozoicomonas sp. SM1973]|uniref:Proline/glycine betaine ABC transporter permease n=1 Tax=Spartinivicinus marinus TaxID=2994442 RepID=A0A853HX23_9GAMM|nr:proline/glycine betaine ABC transporter permease [Spartinivicinus marinus]MCX4029355.1 proline/glycine betaine ABC transporter permease [Spartinivicinus marinus]NYZ64929.1 proline/glycine betaine ABC transporter permease [Spartinivicinus marinus]